MEEVVWGVEEEVEEFGGSVVVATTDVVVTTELVLLVISGPKERAKIEIVVPMSSGIKVLEISLAERILTLSGLTSKFARVGKVEEASVVCCVGFVVVLSDIVSVC